MQLNRPSLLARDDTFFGVCEAIGRDFGFNPNYLRVALGAALLFSPTLVIAGYLVAGLVAAAAHWLFPARMPAGDLALVGDPGTALPNAGNDDDAPLAAAA